jgi:hypothetical protein
MLLKEFFGKAINIGKKGDKEQESKSDDLFWYIVDHDKLHKDYFLPLAQKIKKQHNEGVQDRNLAVMEFMPMVNKGCKEYYIKTEMKGKLGKLFPEELRKDLAERLYDHYNEDIIKDCYSLGI